MSIKQRSVLSTQNTTLSTDKDTAFPDNNNKEITAANLRTWLDELLSQVQDIIDSYFNKLDELRITSTLSYDIVATPSDWNGGTAPATQNLVNDELASRTKALENEPNQTAFETPYTPTTPAEWNPEGAPTEVKGGLDILAGRTFVNKSLNFAVLDSINGNDTTADVGTFLKPYKTGIAVEAALPANGTIIVLDGTGQNITTLKSMNIIGFGVGTKISSIYSNSGTCNVANLEATSGTSFRVSGGSVFYLFNVIGLDCTGVVAGGDFKIYNSTLRNVSFFTEGNGNVINGTSSTKVQGNVKIWGNTFLDTFSITYNSGGLLFNNTFNTGANQPIFWNKGFNTSQPTGKIDIYNNDFLSSATDAILENGGFTQPTIARLWGNYYETTNLFNVTVNNVTRNQFNNQLV